MAKQSILIEQVGAVRTITLNRPERMNAWDEPMRNSLIAALQLAGNDDAVGALVISGAGNRAFSAGQDLNEATHFDADRAERWIEEFANLYRCLRSLEKPVVAAINGICAGSAFQFALLTDLRVGHSDVRMGQVEINSGIASITGPWIMREILGLSRTIELTLTGRLVPAAEALSLGLLNEVVAEDAVRPRASALAAELATKPREAMRLIKRRFFEVLEPGLADAVAAAKRHHRASFLSGEPQATTRKFLSERGGVKDETAG
jgi:enoyl-CoA hydratase/carnithine racemase